MSISSLSARKRWDLVLSLLTLACLCLSLWVPIEGWVAWTWLGSLMLLTGIPHGATDHLLYWQHQRSQGKSPSWKSFLIQYLLQIILYALLWWWLPGLSLVLFLLFSFYHFGQSELYYLDLPESSWLKKSLYLLWGGLIMGIILLSQPAETLPYLEAMLPSGLLEIEMWRGWYLPICLSLGGMWLGGMGWIWLKGKINTSSLLWEVGISLLLALALHVSTLWIAFGLYFGIWHATKSIRTEIAYLPAEINLSRWIRAAWPFTLLSLVGLGLLVGAWFLWGQNLHPVLLFFAGISVLTLPHMSVLEHVYRGVK
ncbi:MAG: Brp/Blh family beta-carotene 15,15'-dioxygenase [Bacteroidota bacterium]